MEYTSQDLMILDEMIQENAKIPLIDNYQTKEALLTESNQINYSIRLIGIPENTMIIKPDNFASPKTIFKGNRGECKRSDFVIISDDQKGKIIVFIEMKAGKAKNTEVIQQLKGSECFIYYCQKIGKSFWTHSSYFLEDYMFRFVAFVKINLNKQKTRYQTGNKPLHDSSETMLKLSRQGSIYFNHLINH